MLLEHGRLANPILVIKHEPNLVLRGQFSSGAKPFRTIYAKVLPPSKLVIETVAHWLGHSVGLPLPEAFIVKVSKSTNPRILSSYIAGESAVAFGTVEVPLARPLTNIQSDLLTARLHKWQHLELAAAFDYLICNDDRTHGNVLLDSHGKFWLIDHSRSLGGAGERLFSSDYFSSVNSIWLDALRKLPSYELLSKRNAIIAVCQFLTSSSSRIPYDAIGVSEVIASQIQSYISRRASRLQAMLFSELSIPDLYASDDSLGSHRQ